MNMKKTVPSRNRASAPTKFRVGSMTRQAPRPHMHGMRPVSSKRRKPAKGSFLKTVLIIGIIAIGSMVAFKTTSKWFAGSKASKTKSQKVYHFDTTRQK